MFAKTSGLDSAPDSTGVQSFLKYWLPVLIWLGVIFVDSTDLMSAEHTSRFIEPFLRWLRSDISPETIARVHLIVRKAAHLTEYGVLALLTLRALRAGADRIEKIALGAVIGIAAIVAACDEYHQSFVASRTASPVDVAIDVTGAALALAILWVCRARRPDPRTLA